MSNSTVALSREQIVYAVEETTAGTLVFPSADTEAILCAGYPTMTQGINKTDSEEVRNTLDKIDRFEGKRPAADVSIPFYLRPSGTLGTAPMGSIFFESLMGLKTVNTSTSVVYSQDTSKKTFSVWCKQGFELYFVGGVVAEQLALSLQNTGAVMLNFTCRGMNLGRAGSATLATGITGASITSVVLGSGEAKRFSVGARIYNKTKNVHNTGVGYTVSAVDVDTNTLTVTAIDGSGTAWEIGDVIEGYLPTPSAFVGTPVESKDIAVSFDGGSSTAKPTSYSLNIGSPVMFFEDEITTTRYPDEYLENVRDINGSFTIHKRKADTEFKYDAREGVTKDLRLTLGASSGSILRIDMDYCDFDFPTDNVNAPAVDMSINFVALGSSGEDSCTLTFI